MDIGLDTHLSILYRLILNWFGVSISITDRNMKVPTTAVCISSYT